MKQSGATKWGRVNSLDVWWTKARGFDKLAALADGFSLLGQGKKLFSSNDGGRPSVDQTCTNNLLFLESFCGQDKQRLSFHGFSFLRSSNKAYLIIYQKKNTSFAD
ncbi:hypothetical protein ABZP36_022122 [Zizania latifolia]